ncbi:MAG: nuclear transport factor 2 family protein [Acidimicrobiia bacterium]|nr:nuclear transport factor 2 family protein [Acidimicrobiia bacterium]
MSTDLEARLRRLEDIEAIKQLKARYCARCDDDYDADGLAALFTEDAVWDGGNTFGVARGREAIRAHFTGASERVTIARHQVMNPIIEIDGHTATGHWLLFQPCTNASRRGEQAVWLAATYADTYRRAFDAEDGWLIASTTIDVAFFTPFDRGWVDQRFLPGREP